MYFPIGYLTADTVNSVISIDCISSDLRDRVLDEAVGLKYSVDSQRSGINIGKVLDIIQGEGNIVGLSVDNLRIKNAPFGLYFIDDPSLGMR